MNCELCGLPMPSGEEMFKFHGYSGTCPGPIIKKTPVPAINAKPLDIAIEALALIAGNRFSDEPFDMKQIHQIAAQALHDIASYCP